MLSRRPPLPHCRHLRGHTQAARCGDPGSYEQVTVRLQSIDAPERKQPFGERARQALAELTFQKEQAVAIVLACWNKKTPSK
ncbi:MAG: thermonuclease family protein [Comamonas testosteroni]|uniref:thermonuclease family protein n=1 Tax=Comamonas testosteroni TaxID=285 RepID=UPI003D1012CA